MAEVTAMRNNALPYPVYAQAFAVTFPLLDADGDPISPSSPDSEKSLNGDTFADCTNEAVEIATSSGICYLLLTAAEMTADIVTVRIQSTGAKTTVLTLYPRKLPVITSGTCQGSNDTSDIQLASGDSAVDDYYNGCLVVAVIDGTTEARIINDYVGSTKVAEIAPAWNTAQPDSDDTYTIYLPEGRQVQQANATHVASTLQAVPGAAGGLFIAGSNAATTISGLTTGALSCTTITASGAVAFQSTFAVTTSTSLAALSCTTLTASGAVAFQSTFVVTTSTNLAALSCTTLTASGAVAFQSTFATTGTTTFNAFTVTNTMTVGTNAIPWNASWDAEVQSEVQDAIVVNNLDHLVPKTGSVNDVSATTTSLNTDLTEATDFWMDATITFTSGALTNQSRVILAYSNTNGNITFDEPLTSAPANGVTFVIQAKHTHTRSQITSDVWSNATRTLTAAVDITSNVKKNQALSSFEFLMTDDTNHAPAIGLTVTVTRSIDGGAFAAGTLSAVTAVGNGIYKVSFGAADLNGNVIMLRATATGADDALERIVTQP